MNALLIFLQSIAEYAELAAAVELMLADTEADRPAAGVEDAAATRDALLALAALVDSDECPALPDGVTAGALIIDLAATVTHLQVEVQAREADLAAADEARAALAVVATAAAEGDEDEDETEDETETETEEIPEEGAEAEAAAAAAALAAAAKPAAKLSRPSLDKIQAGQPAPAAAPQGHDAASGWRANGQAVDTLDGMASALRQAWDDLSSSPGRAAKVRVLHNDLTANAPADRRVNDANIGQVLDRLVRDVSHRSAWGYTDAAPLVASFCAPAEPIYAQPIIGSTARPIRDAHATITAERGTKSHALSPVLQDILVDGVGAAITSLTTAQIEAGVLKTIQCLIDCPDLESTSLEASAIRLCFNNFNSESWPERQAALIELTQIAAARARELQLLGTIDTNLDATTWDDEFGSLRSLLAMIDAMVPRVQGRNRDTDLMFNLIASHTLIPNVRTDALRSMNAEIGMWTISEQLVRSALAERNVNLVLSPDVELFAEIGAETDDLPETQILRLYPAGKFVHMAGPEWTIGVTRSDDDLAANKFQMFEEITETMLHTAPWQGLKITAQLCSSGASAGTVDHVCQGY